jgi:hypothetical protein
VDIYLLKSYSTRIDQSGTPAFEVISNTRLEDKPLVANEDIQSYKQSTYTFRLSNNIQDAIRQFGPDKAFAVTVDKEPVYFGRFHPLYLSSIAFGIATISPGLSPDKELKIDFVKLQGSTALERLDKRDDPRLIDALKASGRLR